jgi:hypothetical protein
MILVHIWDPVHCVLRLAWRSAAAAHRLKPLALATTIACTGITIWPPPPPVEAHSPPPPVQTIVSPPPPIGFFPPPWNIPQSPDTYAPHGYPIPLGPVLPGLGERQTLLVPAGFNETDHGYVPAVADVAPSQTPLCNEDVPPPKSKVSEPGALSLFVVGLMLLFIWRGLGYEK